MLYAKTVYRNRRPSVMLFPMENATLSSEHQQLRALLEQYSEAAKALPTLRAEAPDGWGAALREWWHKGVTSFWEWLKALLEPSPITYASIDWSVVAWSLFWTGMAVLVVWLTYVLTKRYCRYQRSQEPGEGLLPPPDNAADPLGQLLDAAVADQRWDLAARLRWRVFLSRMHCQSHLTPHEFFRTPPYCQRWEQLRGTPISEQYRVMFATTAGSPQWFADYHRGLADLEGEHRRA